MNTTEQIPPHPLLAGLASARRNWGWFLALGIALIVLGMIAIGVAPVATLAWVLVFGWLVLVGGVFESAVAFWARDWSGFFVQLLVGVLSIVVGLLIIGHPLATAGGLTMLLDWPWVLLDGVITVLLGIMICAEWPESSLWVIGTFVGVALLFRGWAWVMFALAARNLPSTT